MDLLAAWGAAQARGQARVTSPLPRYDGLKSLCVMFRFIGTCRERGKTLIEVGDNGVTTGDSVVLEPDSFLMKGGIVDAGAIWLGNPAKAGQPARSVAA